jgi:tetratricopeptide (TPR) repeat protein
MNLNWNSKRDKKKKVIVAAVASAVLVILCGAGIAACRSCSNSAGGTRQNTLALVRKYIDRGDYDRALNLLDSLLIKNADDKDANSMLDEILARKSDTWKGNLGTSGGAGQPAASAEVQNASASAPAGGSKNGAALGAGSSNSLPLQHSALKQQAADAEAERALKQQAADAEAERKAETAAAAAQKAAEEAKRKAEEDALAKKNAALQNQIAKVNAEITAGKKLLSSGKTVDALSHFDSAKKQLPESESKFSAGKLSEIAESLYDASQAADGAGKSVLDSSSADYAEDSLKLDQGDARAHYVLGMQALNTRQYKTAVSELESAVKGDASNYLYLYNLGKAQFSTKSYAEAAESFKTSSKQNRTFVQSLYNLGLTLNKLTKTDEALAAFQSVTSINPQYDKAYVETARILAKKNNTAGSLAAYKQALAINPSNSVALQEAGSVCYSAGKYSDAETYFTKSLSLLKPGESDPQTYYNLSTVLFAENKKSDAYSYAQKAYATKDTVSLAPAKANIVYNYGLMCEQTGKTDDAISAYQEVLSLDPSHVKTKINLGVMFLNMNPPDPDTALRFLNQAYLQEKNNFEVNNNLGSAYLAKKDYANAVTFFQNALKIQPKNNVVRANLAQAYASSEQYDFAKTTYLDVIKADKENWNAYVELGKVYLSLKDNENAKKWLTYVQQLKPDYRADEVKTLLSQL